MKTTSQKIRATIAILITTVALSLSLINSSLVFAGTSSDLRLLPTESDFIYDNSEDTSDSNSGQAQLPEGHLIKDILPAIIKILLGLAGSLALISLLVGSYYLVGSQGNEDSIKKGKEILTWAGVAFIIISLSYAIIFGIIKIRYPNETTPVPPEEETSFL